ncbi:hypothetical protein HispidOSU_005192, partial [Sigmodon hispidus]
MPQFQERSEPLLLPLVIIRKDITVCLREKQHTEANPGHQKLRGLGTVSVKSTIISNQKHQSKDKLLNCGSRVWM